MVAMGTHLYALLGILSNADGRLVLRCTEQIQNILIVDLQ